jgi:hypothetical protein
LYLGHAFGVGIGRGIALGDSINKKINLEDNNVAVVIYIHDVPVVREADGGRFFPQLRREYNIHPEYTLGDDADDEAEEDEEEEEKREDKEEESEIDLIRL